MLHSWVYARTSLPRRWTVNAQWSLVGRPSLAALHERAAAQREPGGCDVPPFNNIWRWRASTSAPYNAGKGTCNKNDVPAPASPSRRCPTSSKSASCGRRDELWNLGSYRKAASLVLERTRTKTRRVAQRANRLLHRPGDTEIPHTARAASRAPRAAHDPTSAQTNHIACELTGKCRSIFVLSALGMLLGKVILHFPGQRQPIMLRIDL